MLQLQLRIKPSEAHLYEKVNFYFFEMFIQKRKTKHILTLKAYIAQTTEKIPYKKGHDPLAVV